MNVLKHAFVVVIVLGHCPCIVLAQIQPAPLPVKLRPQEQFNWCWAACGEMIMETLGTRVRQCVQANDQFHCGGNCCNGASVPKCCDTVGWPEFDKYDFSSKYRDFSGLSWQEIKDELSRPNSRPFAFANRERGGGVPHMMVAYGYVDAIVTREILIRDPWPPHTGDSRTIEYDDYLGLGTSQHVRDYFAVESNPAPAPPLLAGSPLAQLRRRNKLRQANGEAIAFDDAIRQATERAKRKVEVFNTPAYLEILGLKNGDHPLRLGEAIPVVWIGLDDVLKAEGKLPPQLEHRLSTMVEFPVLAGDDVIRAMDVQCGNGNWEIVRTANTTMTRILIAKRQELAKRREVKTSEVFEVSIPGMNLFFAGCDRKEGNERLGIDLLPLIDYPSLELSAEEMLDASKAFARIYEAAIDMVKDEAKE